MNVQYPTSSNMVPPGSTYLHKPANLYTQKKHTENTWKHMQTLLYWHWGILFDKTADLWMFWASKSGPNGGHCLSLPFGKWRLPRGRQRVPKGGEFLSVLPSLFYMVHMFLCICTMSISWSQMILRSFFVKVWHGTFCHITVSFCVAT